MVRLAVLAVALTLLAITYFYPALLDGVYPGLCAPPETVAVCVRLWADPIAALFTVVAIVFAVAQVREATRQSDAAVRENLTIIRSELELEYSQISSVISKLGAAKKLTSSDAPSIGDVDEAARLSQEIDLRQLGVWNIDTERALTKGNLFKSVRLSALQEFLSQLQNLDPNSRPQFIHTAWKRYTTLVEGAFNACVLRTSELAHELDVIRDAIANIDSDALREARRTAGMRKREFAAAVMRPPKANFWDHFRDPPRPKIVQNPTTADESRPEANKLI